MTTASFTTLPLAAAFLDNLKSLDYHTMTPIQAQGLPVILTNKDVKGQAKTGSGKTAAFGIGLLHKLDPLNYQTQALVLCPTRELADQVSNEIRRLARAIPNTKMVTLCGGKPMAPQLASLEHEPHIVVGTPGRILKHLEKGTLKLSAVQTLVLDEADRMLDMGFHDDIMRIIDKTPSQRQTLLFSATYPVAIKAISQRIQNDPIDIHVESMHDNSKIEQIFFEIASNQRMDALINLLHHYQPQTSVVFCNRKQQCQEVSDALTGQGFHAQALHGDLEQKERDQVLVQFSNRSSSILVATDVAARGIDIKELAAVIIYEISPDPEVHIHRIGRTGRADKEGLALSLFMASEASKVNAIEKYQAKPVTIEKLSSLKHKGNIDLVPPMISLRIGGGRKNKISAGDILGALTAGKKLNGKQIGKINLFDNVTFVAVERTIAPQALTILSDGKIKGRKYRVHKLS